MSELTDLEKNILAEGKKVEQTIREEVLNLRKSAIVKELEAIEEELASFIKAAKAKPAPAKKDEKKSETPPAAKS